MILDNRNVNQGRDVPLVDLPQGKKDLLNKRTYFILSLSADPPIRVTARKFKATGPALVP
jgi:hypothetical protein